MTSPFLPAQTAAMLQSMLPAWAPRAACAGKAPNQAPWAPMFRDEVAAHKDDSYSWPAETIRAMQTCAGCPVRAECLAYGFKGTPTTGRHFGVYGGVPGRIRESRATDPCPTCDGSGFLDEVLGIPFATYAWLHTTKIGEVEVTAPGYPCYACRATGAVRSEQREMRCDEWFRTYATQQGWVVNDLDQGETVSA